MVTRSRLLALATAAVTAVTLTGCGAIGGILDEADSAGRVKGVGNGEQVCALLDESEVDTFLGGAAGPPVPADDSAGGSCDYRAEGVFFWLQTSAHAYEDKTQQRYDETKATYASTDPIDGLGDEAYSVIAGNQAIVAFRLGDRIGGLAKSYLTPLDGPDDADIAALTDLAAAMAGRLTA